MDAAAHPTKPSTPPYGSPGNRQCISHNNCVARGAFDGRAAVGVPLGHRARIKQAHKNRHPEMWAHRDSEVQ